MYKKAFLIIFLAVSVAYGNTLFNGFVGDDQTVVENNTFYESPSNILKLFSREYNTDTENLAIFISRRQDIKSGSVAYRPVLSLTYFFDTWVWGKNPAGFHLTNLILHCVCSFLVFWLLFLLTQNQKLSLLSSLLFAVHPVNAEAVCNIGYRADLLAAIFTVLSVKCYVLYRSQKKGYEYFFSLIACFLGLFSKESAIVILPLIVMYDVYFSRFSFKQICAGWVKEYSGFLLVTVFYLYVYFFVFPNTALHQSGLMGGSLPAHAQEALEIFTQYLIYFIFPTTIQVLPPFYYIKAHSFWIVAAPVFVLFIWGMAKSFLSNRIVSYFLLWYLVALFPVSNIIPVVNPMALRFLYLPAIGMLTVLAVFIEWVVTKIKTYPSAGRSVKLIRFGVVLICISFTVPLNNTWRDQYHLSDRLMRYYPQDPWGRFFMGLEYFRYGAFEQSRSILLEAEALGLEDPRMLHMLGVTYSNDPQKAKKYFLKSITLYPDYTLAYIGMGRVLLLNGDKEKALPYFQKSIELNPSYTAYGYLIQIYLINGQVKEAERVLKDAEEVITKENELRSLKRFFIYEKKDEFPIDIGV